ncbi:carbohydrate-binding module family 13 protein [Rhizophagus clarus]|uniref:Carbohydrate-binding module family 13 protein n=1 Tax=Rhizophagus clarus TaxID=94130 RepID=A0A8H3KUS5_9GLOM|nr:carbohydrate-binding module family 13 protein [Rhizophagus clarus]
MDDKLLQKLSQNLLEILDDEEYYDVTIEVNNGPDVKIFRAHMIILNYRSPYLRRILSINKKKNFNDFVHIKLLNILPRIFQGILRYIYGGELLLEEYDVSDIIKILIAANELGLEELTLYIESFLVKNRKNWIEQNYNFIYRISFESNSFFDLQRCCIDLVSKEPIKILNSLNFSTISEKFLISLIQENNLRMSESQVWEYVIKWGLAQNSELPSDPTRCSKDDFKVLKNTLKRCIPFIKFQNLTSKEFSRKVLPYKRILPKELYRNLLDYFLDIDIKILESRVKEIKLKIIDSKIVTFQHVELISKWIDKLETRDKLTSSCEFKLLYRDTRDGSDGMFNRFKKFHEVCDDKSRTLTIIKVKDCDEIIGGYNPIEWKSDDSHGITKDSFIFSFSNDDVILSRVSDDKKAIFNGLCYGPSFGDRDLYVCKTLGGELRILCRKKSYERQIRETHTTFLEFEVFQIS